MRNGLCLALASGMLLATTLRAQTPAAAAPARPSTFGLSSETPSACPVPGTTVPAPDESDDAAVPRFRTPAWGPTTAACQTPPAPPQNGPASRASGSDGVFWIEGDYLLWAMRGSPTPPLVTSAPASSTAAAPGALGNPDTTILFGGRQANDGLRSGFRVGAGFWFSDLLEDCFDAVHDWGLEADFFYLSPGRQAYTSPANDPNGSVFRPFFNTATGQPGSEDVLNLADGITGQAAARIDTQFSGGEANLRHNLFNAVCCGNGTRVDMLLGYRAESLTDDLTVSENLTTLDLAGNPNGSILLQDRFRSTNLFQGGQVGLDGLWWRQKWFVDVRGLLAVGVTHQTVDVEGVTVTQAPGAAPLTQAGGLYALPSNMGRYDRDRFSLVPSLGAALGYQLTHNLSASVGYELTYWSSVVRAGNQIDPTVNPYYIPGPPDATLSPTPARPAFPGVGSDFWAQGITISLELQY